MSPLSTVGFAGETGNGECIADSHAPEDYYVI